MDAWRGRLTVVTNTQVALAVIIVGLWCGGYLVAAVVLALLNR